MVDAFPVGAGPYTYSDFTGFGLRTITRATGDYTILLEACDNAEKADWRQVVFDADVPAQTTVQVYVRPGDDLAARAVQPQRHAPGPAMDLERDHGAGHLQPVAVGEGAAEQTHRPGI
jgi:hypothetical protein